MNRLIFTSLASVLLLSGGALGAQEAASPSLTARIDGVVGAETQALEIERLEIEVEQHGSLAMTELTVTFANPTDTTLEGEFAIDLPRGSVVTGYALDVAGVMIDGVLQSRDRAREAFERRVVRRIDPGLAEVDFSDRFETRVYPLFPRQGRTIRIRFATGEGRENSSMDRMGPSFRPAASVSVFALAIACFTASVRASASASSACEEAKAMPPPELTPSVTA